MTPKQFKSRFDGQSSIAKKVYQFVPIQEPWSHSQISTEMQRTTGARTDHRIMQGCINTMIESGIVREVEKGKFQRTEIRDREEPQQNTETFIDTEKAAPMPKQEEKPNSAIEILSDISRRLNEVSSQVKSIASDVETAAIVIEDNVAQKEAGAAKLKQLQELLKGL